MGRRLQSRDGLYLRSFWKICSCSSFIMCPWVAGSRCWYGVPGSKACATDTCRDICLSVQHTRIPDSSSGHCSVRMTTMSTYIYVDWTSYTVHRIQLHGRTWMVSPFNCWWCEYHDYACRSMSANVTGHKTILPSVLPWKRHHTTFLSTSSSKDRLGKRRWEYRGRPFNTFVASGCPSGPSGSLHRTGQPRLQDAKENHTFLFKLFSWHSMMSQDILAFLLDTYFSLSTK